MLEKVRELEKKLGVESFRFDHFPENQVERVRCIRCYMVSLMEKVAEQNNKRKGV